MIKKIAAGLLAAAATTALALALPAAASASTASTDDYSGYWGPFYSANHLAKAQGWVDVEWDHAGESNTVDVRGRLYDLDNRTYGQGGKCAYVKFQTENFDGDWSNVYTRKYCGFPGYKKFSFSEDDVHTLRVKVCQAPQYGGYVSRCGSWRYLYNAA
ncbi:hypothetical protein [Nonomuraea longicatena]|uniref:F5/8 type C domain-containing protein n=1 Tax=Nonomuraea longicatena TaxID=83682 RepID=A0ABP4BIG6_9ACTN